MRRVCRVCVLLVTGRRGASPATLSTAEGAVVSLRGGWARRLPVELARGPQSQCSLVCPLLSPTPHPLFRPLADTASSLGVRGAPCECGSPPLSGTLSSRPQAVPT